MNERRVLCALERGRAGLSRPLTPFVRASYGLTGLSPPFPSPQIAIVRRAPNAPLSGRGLRIAAPNSNEFAYLRLVVRSYTGSYVAEPVKIPFCLSTRMNTSERARQAAARANARRSHSRERHIFGPKDSDYKQLLPACVCPHIDHLCHALRS